MKVTPALKKELAIWLDTYWTTYLKGDIKTWATFIRDDYRNIGGTKEEIWNSKQEILDYTYSILDQMIGTVEIRNRKVELIPYGEYMMVNEFTDLYIKIDSEWIFYGPFRMSSLLEKTTTGWIALHQHGSYPDMKAMEGEAFSFDALKAENVKLQAAVKSRTIELEIETALEKVRAVALGMKMADDMLSVCKTIAQQLAQLGVKEIRNVQTAIFYETKGTYMNYEYYARHDKTFITDVDFKTHKIQLEFANKMMKGPNEEMREQLKGEKLLDWYAYQKTTNQFADKHLQKAHSLNYYWYSLGPVALGISTYYPLTNDETVLFKRFLNVFELAYTRYLDIEQAIAQAKEAKIEAGLERVRSRSLAMHNTSELQDVIHTVHKELLHLNIAIHGGSFITINSDIINQLRCWGAGGTADTTAEVHLPLYEKPFCTNLINGIKKGPVFFTEEFTQEEKKEFFKFLFNYEPWSKLNAKEKKETLSSPGGYTRSCCVSPHTSIFIVNEFGEKFSNADNDILQRFGKVFEQSYSRFLDLQKAEAQAREAQIELGLERVRARAMAMQKSEELSELVDTVFKELTKLDFALNWCIINIIDEPSLSNMVWAANPETNKPPESYLMKFEDYPFHHSMMKGYQERKTKHIYVLEGKEKKTYDDYLFNKTEWKRVPKEAQAASRAMKRYVASFTFSNFGGLQTVGEEPLSEDNLDILSRFGKVFDLTYTRFNDLQKAEAQAREAEIQLALERVRAKSLAMHHTSELQEIVHVVAQQLQQIGVNSNGGVFISINKEVDQHLQLWASSGMADYVEKVTVPVIDGPIFNELREAIKKGNNFFDKVYSKEAKDEMFRHLFQFAPWNALPPERKEELLLREGGLTRTAAISQNTSIVITNHNGKRFSAVEIDILKRFGYVFEQAYTRFLDLQKAEAQAREAQIEASLERVRSRSMAMHKSDELHEAGELLWHELTRLGIQSLTSGYVLIDSGEEIGWTYAPDPKTGKIFAEPLGINQTKTKEMLSVLESWRKQEVCSVIEMNEEETIAHQTFIAEQSLNPDGTICNWITAELLISLSPERLFLHNFNFNQGYLMIVGGIRLTQEQTDLMSRFTKVFQQTYTRFLDLQKAESQTREAKIEAALEKVRSRSLAMHKSDELGEVIMEIKKKFQELEISMDSRVAVVVVFDNYSRNFNQWVASPDFSNIYISTPYFQNPILEDFWTAREGGVDFYSKAYSLEVKNNYFKYFFENSRYQNTEGLEEQKKWLFEQAFYAYSPAFEKNSSIGIADFSGKSLTESDIEIIKRFAKVFEQAYTRFLDLQKAEAQAREAKIEAALEKVRSRTMAMRKGEELKEVVVLLYKELILLGCTNFVTCGYVEINEQTGRQLTWVTGPGGDSLGLFYLPLTGDSTFDERYAAWKEQQPVFHQSVAGENRSKHLEYAITTFNSKEAEEMVQSQFPDPTVFYCFNFSHGYLHLVGGSLLSKEDEILLARFTRVFEQTYARFLDLQKAEAQAREAKIEAALEKVRSRTMAMQHSDELPLAANVLFLEVQALGIPSWSCGYNIFSDDKKSCTCIMSSEGQIQSAFHLPFSNSGEPSFTEWLLAIDTKQSFLVQELSGKAINDHYNYMKTLPQVGVVIKELEDAGFSLPTYQINHLSFFNGGFLLFITYEQVPHAHDIFKRFTKVFEQTYTRFLDLQKAEEQAREAKIEAALERTRTQSMIMQHSKELDDTLRVFHEQILFLGINSAFSYLWLPDEEKNQHIFWAAWAENSRDEDPTGQRLMVFKSKAINYALDRTEPATAQCLIDWKSDEPVHTYHISSEGVENYFGAWKELLNGVEKLTPEHFRGGLSYVEAFMKYGCFGVLSKEDLTQDEKKILLRFSIEFERTYTRFLDLQKAEAQTRQAHIETALERVRARALAMQEPEELTAVAEVLRHEMGLLGVEELETCSIFINDAQAEKAECWYALKDIHSNEQKLVSDHFALNLLDTWVGREMLQFYNSPDIQTSVLMQGANRKEWINYCEEKSIPFRGYYGQVIPDRTYHLYKFSHGAIGAAAADDISTESWGLLKRAAAVFSLAYSRFKDLTQARKDLQRLKEEKQRAEDALTNLQAAQKQLVQSEKMASLGELTAGIAHEIQNPLNFVNNFSEVSKELLDEMNAELAMGNLQLAIEIANDVKQNLEKINHHGKRADGIVKGMLQHSRSSNGVKEPTDINALCDEYLRLSYHGLRAKDKSFNATIKTDFDNSIGNINIIPQDIGRVVLNLLTNAFYAAPLPPEGGFSDPDYVHNPTVLISTKKVGDKVLIRVKDNGPGIPQKIVDKIFQPFFTTKPTGQGTGLGLSLSYDIITKGHGGELKVETKEHEGSTFIISLPVNTNE